MNGPILVRDVMRPPVVAPEGMWFKELVRLQRDHDSEFLAIVDTRGRAVGALTEEDLLLKLASRWVEQRPAFIETDSRRVERRKAAGVTARELMTERLITIAESAPAAGAASLMRRRRVRHLAVLDSAGRPVGVVHRSDLLDVLLRADEEVRQDVEDLLARKLHGDAERVGVEVVDGVVLLRRLGDVDAGLDGVIRDVLEVEGVLAARAEAGARRLQP